MKNIRPLLSALLTTGIALAQATARADSAATIQTDATGTGVTYDDAGSSGSYPIVTTILSAPHGTVYNSGATLDGYTYNNWSYLAADTTGSLDLFYFSSIATGYTPTVGDSLLVQGNYSPFSGIPEIATSTAHPLSITYGNSGNTPYSASPMPTTIPTISVGTNGHALSASGLGGTLLQLNNVFISGVSNGAGGPVVANWVTHANNEGLLTDGDGNSMIMYLWASSYSTCGAIAQNGDPIPTGPVDMTGFISDFYSTATSSIQNEFVPTSIVSVPEPVTFALYGVGALAWAGYRLRKRR